MSRQVLSFDTLTSATHEYDSRPLEILCFDTLTKSAYVPESRSLKILYFDTLTHLDELSLFV